MSNKLKGLIKTKHDKELIEAVIEEIEYFQKGENDILQEILEQTRQELQQLLEESDEEALRKELEEKEEIIDKLREVIEERTLEREWCEKELKGFKEGMDSLESFLDKAAEKEDKLGGELMEQEQKIKELERRLESKKDRVKELEEELGKRNKELRAIKSALESDNPVKQLAKQKETTQFWGEEAMKLEQLLREKDQQPKAEEIFREAEKEGGWGGVSFEALEEILKKHLN